MGYRLVIFDLGHFMSLEHAQVVESLATVEDACELARERVQESLQDVYEPGMSAEELYRTYISHGEDPVVYEGEKMLNAFSATLYAREIVDDMWGLARESALRAVANGASRFPIGRVGEESRISEIRLTNRPFRTDANGFIRDICRIVRHATAFANPLFIVPIPVLIELAPSGTEIGGYHDYSISGHTARLMGDDGFGLEVRVYESSGYDPSESRVEVVTIGIEPAYVFGFAELENGQGFLGWKHIDLTPVVSAAIPEL